MKNQKVFAPSISGGGQCSSTPIVLDIPFAELGEFVYHCHILEHEDGGMMAKIQVVPSPIDIIGMAMERLEWQTALKLWVCSLIGLSSGVDTAPTVAAIQAAYDQEAALGTSKHDKNLMLIEAKCDAGQNGRFRRQVTFLSKDDPSERLYFDIVAIARVEPGWRLKNGLCKR
jgi:hypothetical protein